MKEFKKILTNPNFLSLLISQVISQLTVNVLSFLILIEIFAQTGSTIATSLLWVAYAVPAIIIGPVAAASVDFIDKRIVLSTANFLQALTVIVYALLLYRNLIFLPYIIVFTYSFLNQFYVPAEAAALPLFVNKDDLPQANGVFFITQQSALVVGFGLAGILHEVVGFRPTILLMGLLLVIAFVSVLLLPKRNPKNKLAKEFEDKMADFFYQIKRGYLFIRNTKRVLYPFILLLALQVITAVIVTNLPRIATDIVNITPGQSGFLVVLPAGVGAVAGTLMISDLLNKGMRKRKIIFVSFGILAISTALAATLVPLVNISWARIIFGIILFAFTGFSVVGVLVPSITYLQESTPKELLGRVFGNFWFLTTIVTILPVLFSATVTDLLGVKVLLISVSAACFSVLFYSYYKIKDI